MKISSKGLELIKKFEGCRLTAYKCPAGVWTIGYGHTGKVDGKAICSGMKITASKATSLLSLDLATFEKAVTNCKYLTFKPNQNQFDALVSFAYNCGTGSLNTLVKNRSAAVVSEKLLLYNKANGKVLAGLVNRRKAEKELFDTPVSSKNSSSSNDSKTTVTTIKKGAKVKIKSGAKDLNTKNKYSDFVYATEYVVHKVAATYVVFGNGTTATGKTRKKNVIVQ